MEVGEGESSLGADFGDLVKISLGCAKSEIPIGKVGTVSTAFLARLLVVVGEIALGIAAMVIPFILPFTYLLHKRH